MTHADVVVSGADMDPPAVPLSQRGPASTDVVVRFGFWLFLLSDIVVFSALFAAYAVLSHQTAGGPTGPQLFERGRTLLETGCLLTSSFTCGVMSLAVQRRSALQVYGWAAATFALGCVFVGLEVSEFAGLIAAGAGPTRSAFLSAFFTLVGTHGLHVSLGLCWLLVMMAQVATIGFRPMVMRRLLCFSLFWHALDIVWIGVFTIVYLGAR
ncbi:cytochrome o ubiquinol oxidase subunit III [Mesorhizobium loti]|uniref:cytochrome o ubiquinol oxidase subunit III n=1 Tax=Rhizobium loti TaxID=381 RepID=UPI00053A1947